jgi:hypothetical protein
MQAERLVKCFHVSRMVNRQSILEKGLLTSDSEYFGYENRLCFSIDENNLGFDYVGFYHVDIWSFVMPESKLILDADADLDCHMYINENVLPENLTLEYTIDEDII